MKILFFSFTYKSPHFFANFSVDTSIWPILFMLTLSNLDTTQMRFDRRKHSSLLLPEKWVSKRKTQALMWLVEEQLRDNQYLIGRQKICILVTAKENDKHVISKSKAPKSSISIKISSDSACQHNISWHDGNSLCVNCRQVGVLQHWYQKVLGCLV